MVIMIVGVLISIATGLWEPMGPLALQQRVVHGVMVVLGFAVPGKVIGIVWARMYAKQLERKLDDYSKTSSSFTPHLD
jgi:hypothetical protein